MNALLAKIDSGLEVQKADGSHARALSGQFLNDAVHYNYSYRFSWLGLPIIQLPQDILAMQQIIWEVRPDLIIETGIAHGGSLILYASLLELNALCGGPEFAEVLGVEINLYPENRRAINSHPLFHRISMVEGSSISPAVIRWVQDKALGKGCVLVCLDSNHTHAHVLAELEAYAPLVTPGSYCVVFDTAIEDISDGSFPDRPWGKGNNPATAVREYLVSHPEFAPDEEIDRKLLISSSPGGYLKRKGEHHE